MNNILRSFFFLFLTFASIQSVCSYASSDITSTIPKDAERSSHNSTATIKSTTTTPSRALHNSSLKQPAPPVSVSKTHTAPLSVSNATNSASYDGWISVSTGFRPVYIGIHGGTAPLSIVRASNGTLFAFTGQTGNDFVYVLKGSSHNASESKPTPEGSSNATSNDEERNVNATLITNSTLPPTSNASLPTTTTFPVKGYNGSVAPTALTNSSGLKSAPLSSEAQKKTSNPQKSSVRTQASPTPPPPLSSTLLAKEQNSSQKLSSQELVIASGTLTNQLAHPSNALLPFGLNAEDSQEITEPALKENQSKRAPFRKVVLGSYQKILSR